MQATQSRKASGSWCRDGQFAALRYVSRHLNIAAGLDAGDSVEWERGSRRGLLPVTADTVRDAHSGDEDRTEQGYSQSSYAGADFAESGYAARAMDRRDVEERARSSGASLAPQRVATIEEGSAGWIGC